MLLLNQLASNTLCMAQGSVPRDLPLPLPLNEVTLKTLLIPLFLLHIVFVNLMVGGSLLTIIYEMLGLRDRKFDYLAQRVADTVTVNKSMAVVLGVGPLLVISLAYTLQFYSSNSLTGHAWILIIPLITLAFVTTYIHKYTWSKWSSGGLKRLHIGVGIISTLLFLAIPWIFLANVNLMQFPDRWYDVRGFFSSLKIGNGNVYFRYLHFMAACLAVTSLFLCIWLTRSQRVIRRLPDGFSKGQLRRHFYRIALYVTLAQFLIGPLTLLVMPRIGLDITVVTVFMVGTCLAFVLVVALWKETVASDEQVGKLWVPIFFVFQLVAYSMGTGRQMYREVALADHIEQVKIKTDEFEAKVYLANLRRQSGLSAEADGKELFRTVCANCHLPDKATSAPTSTEVLTLYANKPDEIVAWAMKPGRKRTQFSAMPPMAQLGEKRLRKIAEFMASASTADAASLAAPIPADAYQNLKPEDARAKILASTGNPTAGKELFASKTCITCHAQGETPLRRAPSLASLAQQQDREAILESIINPSAKFAKGYEPTSVLTVEGQSLSGFVVEETDEHLILRQQDGQLIELSSDDVEATKKLDQSPMPKGLIDTLSPQQIADLVAYLQTL